MGRNLLNSAKKAVGQTIGAVSPVAKGMMEAVKIAKTVPKVAGAIKAMPTPSMAQTQQAGMIPMSDQTPNTKQQLTPAPTDAQLTAARAQAPQSPAPAQLAAVSAVRQGTTNAPIAPQAPVAPTAPRQDTGAGRVTLIGPDGSKVTAPAGSAVMQGYIRQGYTQEGAQAPTAPVAPQVTSGAIVEPPATPGTLTAEQQRDALRQSLLESMRIGSQEGQTQSELDALNADANAAIYDVEATGSRRGFTTGYATGLQGAIGRQAEIAKLPLEARIANLQAQRNADRAATQAQLGFVESDINQQQQTSRQDQEAKRAILLQALQGGATQEQMAQILGAKTPDEAIQLAGSLLQQKTAPKYESVSPGQTLIDPATGQVIYQAPVTAKGGSGGGAGGSSGGLSGGTSALAQAVLSGTLNLEDLTPTQRGQIASELAAGGYQRTANVSAGTRETIAKFDNVLAQAQNADNLINSLNTGPIASRLGSLGQITGTGSNEFTQYKSAISNLSSILLNQLSGAAVAPSEATRLMGFIPSVNDQQNVAKEKLRLFQAGIQQAQQAYLNRATQTSQQLAASGQQAGGEIDPLGVRN